MATLAQGQAARLDLKASQSITVTPASTGRATVSANGPSNLTYEQKTIYAAETFGPYVADTVMHIAAVAGSLEYSNPYTLVPSYATDASNNVTGLVGPDGGNVGLGSQSASYRTVLFGDSMTSQYWVDTVCTASYAPSTGVLTVTSVAHVLATGWTVYLFNRSHAAIKAGADYVLTRVDADTFTVNIGANLAGMPTGALTGNTYVRVPTRQGSNSWVNWYQMLAGWPLDIVYNGAQSGDTTGDCLSRIAVDCLDYNPRVVLMQMPGINDMSTGNGPIDEATIFANQCEIVDKILARNALLVCLPMTPVYTGEARATLQNGARVSRLNRKLAQYLQGKAGAFMVDAYSKIVNPTSATGLAVADYVKSTDFIHYSIPGALRVAKAVKTKLDQHIASGFYSLPSSAVDSFGGSDVTASSVTISGGIATFNSTAHGFLAGESVGVFGASATGTLDGWVTILTASADAFTFATSASGTVTGTVVASRSRNVFDNCVLATTTGGTVTSPVTGTTGDGWNARFHSGSGTAAASVVANADGIGNAQRLVVSAAEEDYLPGFQSEVTSTLNRYAQAGETFYMEGDLRIASANWGNTPITEIMFRLICTVDSVLYSAHAINTYDGLTGVSVAEDLALHVRTPDLLVPAGTVSQFYWQVYVRCSGTVSSDLTLDLSRLAVMRKDA